MKIVTKTPKKVVLEVQVNNIEKYGFDFVWDEVRDKFPENKFGKFSINDNSDDGIVIFELLNMSSESKSSKSTAKKAKVRKVDTKVLEREIKKS